MYNFQQYRHIQSPGWSLQWTWAKKEVIWSMLGGQTTEQGDCSRFKGNVPHCCKKDPTVVDLLPGTPYNQQIANCCKGGVVSSWVQDPANAASSFQVSVGSAGTTNKTVRLPKNFTLKAPGPGYTCGPAKIVKPTRFVTQDGRRVTQALSKFLDEDYRVFWIHLCTSFNFSDLDGTMISQIYGWWCRLILNLRIGWLSTITQMVLNWSGINNAVICTYCGGLYHQMPMLFFCPILVGYVIYQGLLDFVYSYIWQGSDS